MAEHIPYQQSQLHPSSQLRYQVVKAATAATAGGSLLCASGLTLTGTVVCFAIATPLLVIFSPVLVPAVITVALLILGFVSSGGFCVAGLTVLSWIYRYVTGKHPPGADQLDEVRDRLATRAKEMKARADKFGQEHISRS